MATATKKIEREVIETVTVQLDMSLEEARSLAMVLARVGGSPSESRRKHIESALKALEARIGDSYNFKDKYQISGSLHFAEAVDFD